MSLPPTGTITFLFTDIEGSAHKWERHPEAMQRALQRHDTILRQTFESNEGYVFKTMGDAFCVAFDTGPSAVNAALQVQRALRAEEWEGIGELKVRAALHTGAAEHRDGDYFGQSLNRVSRILAAAQGGQTLLSLATEELVRDQLSGGVQLRALGEHRLRDLARPEHLFQLVAPDLPSAFGALRSLESVPNNLPQQLTSFIGREREISEVKSQLAQTRLLTLTGTGGTGKTRLSLQVAAEVLDTFSDGVWFVEFGTIDDAGLVGETIASALDVRQEPERPLLWTLTNFLRSKRLLLVFDNCEHVVAACATVAETLLRACPHLRILASSREPLGIAGETAFPLPPLSLPEHWSQITEGADAIERLGEFEAVRLFVERAKIARSNFQITSRNAAQVARICWRLDGIPLAIELAAARVKVLTLEQILERLDDRFRLLTGGARTAVPRQQALRSLIDWSYDLLSERERRLLRRLSVFARGRTLEAIESVCSGEGVDESEIIDLLTQLVDKSLVTAEKTPNHGVRYFILESLWDYTREKLEEAGESERFRVRHLNYFVRYAEQCEPRILGPEQRDWLKRLEEDRLNIRYAVETSIEIAGHVPEGLRLLSATERFIEVHGLIKEASEAFAKLLAHPEAAARDTVRALSLATATRLAWISDDFAAAKAYASEALEIWREIGAQQGEASAGVDLGLLSWGEGDLAGAEARLGEAARVADTLGEPRLTAHLRHAQAILASARRDYRRALELDRESNLIYRQLGDLWMALIIEWAIGINATVLGECSEAHARFASCLQGGLDLGNRWGLPYPLEAFAVLALVEGQELRAARLFGAAEGLRAKAGISAEGADHPAFQELVSGVRERLATGELGAARMAARSMSSEEAIALALES